MAQSQLEKSENGKFSSILSFKFNSGPLRLTTFKVDEILYLNICNMDRKFDMVTITVTDYITWANKEIFMKDSTLCGGTAYGLTMDLIKTMDLLSIRSEIENLAHIFA